ncbi:MAG: alpha/beta hydrolase, partial [Microcystaceae cyanobacterium]
MQNLNRLVFRRWMRSLILGLASSVLTAMPTVAAERISLIYGFLKVSVRVDSLATFAKDGTVNQDLAFFLNRVSPEEQAAFREALLKRADISPILLHRFFNSEIGEAILLRIGRLVNIQGGSNAKYPLRGAMIQAAADPEGLTLLNFLKKFPTNMQFDGEKLLAFSEEVERIIDATKVFPEVMEQLSAEEIATETPVDFSTLPDIRNNGPFAFEKKTWTLKDESRDRTFYVIVYKPQPSREGKTPVVIISHGLASRPEDFAARAEHLASYGFVVALPQHPGSDFQQAQALLNGLSRNVFALNEFIDRPKDISYVIDELERRNQSEFAGRLNLE